MDKFFDRYEDVHVAATVVYPNDNKAYKEAAHTNQLTTSELKNLFIKGMLIALGDGAFAAPIKYAEAESIGSVYYIVPNGTTATSADIAAIAAKADPA